MKIEEALVELGVGDDLLTEAQKEHLDREGYVILENLLSPQQVEELRAALDRISAEEGENAGKEQHQEAGTNRIADLVNKDSAFDNCWTHPRVLAAVVHVLGKDIKLFAFSSRSALPGQGEQMLHKDGFYQPTNPGEFYLCNTAWLLDEFTAENGATRIVPGSHRVPGVPVDISSDPLSPHPNEIKVLAPAGSVIVFNSHMLHGGTRNLSGEPRRVVHAAYSHRAEKPLTDQREFLRPETANRLSEAAKVLLDVA